MKMRKELAYVVTGIYVVGLIALHMIGAVTGFVGAVFTTLTKIITFSPKRIKRIWEEYVNDIKYF